MFFSILFLCFALCSASSSFLVQSSCTNIFPVLNNSGPGCSVPTFVDPEEFGDNLQSSGYAFFRTSRRGTRLTIKVKGLSRPDLVLTAWLIWADPRGPVPEIFNKVARLASPVAPTFGRFTDGFGREPNSLRYLGSSRAVLRTFLDFDITKPNTGPLTARRPFFQSDIPGIEDTPFKQYETPNGNLVPVTSSFLRVFDPSTGFQKLDARGRPETVKSPVPALGISVVAHLDKTTHGISAGRFGTDHFDVLFFNLTKALEGTIPV